MSIDGIFEAYNHIKDNETYFKTYMKYWKGVHFVGEACSFLNACYRQTVCAIRNIRKNDIKQWLFAQFRLRFSLALQ